MEVAEVAVEVAVSLGGSAVLFSSSGDVVSAGGVVVPSSAEVSAAGSMRGVEEAVPKPSGSVAAGVVVADSPGVFWSASVSSCAGGVSSVTGA